MAAPEDPQEGLRDRISARGEEAIGELAEALLDNPIFNNTLQAALGAREKALQAQRGAMGALNLPSASELERLERRLRSLSDRLEGVEEQIDQVARDVSALRAQLAEVETVSAEQERLRVQEEA